MGVSPSFLSQIENGKSQPSVSTLYAISKLLGVAVDNLFNQSDGSLGVEDEEGAITRTDLSHPTDAWSGAGSRISIVNAQSRSVISMDKGVKWERLAATPESDINFMEITYAPGAESNSNGEMISHDGYEYGYALEGDIEVTLGDSVFSLAKNQSIGFDSTIPHRFRNNALVPFKGIWFVHGGSHTENPVIPTPKKAVKKK